MKTSEKKENQEPEIDSSIPVNGSSQRISQPGSIQPAVSFGKKVWNSFNDSIGEIVFGMEDGTVSIFGLVFGLAASAQNSHQVLLAGATGAAAAAISMMAGTYLDVESTQAKAKADIDHERMEIEQSPQEEIEEIRMRLRHKGFAEAEITQILEVLARRPEIMLKYEIAAELQIGRAEQQNPVIKSLWMLIADLFAAAVPVVPFALYPLAIARAVSLGITFLLLLFLGIARGLIGRRNVLTTALQTVIIAAAAAAAGVFIGKWISK